VPGLGRDEAPDPGRGRIFPLPLGTGEHRLKRLIVTADDFGAALEVNGAVERAFTDGILTTTSLMIAAPAAPDAVTRAKSLSGLAVGLHIVVVRGNSVLPRAEIPTLVDAAGGFDRNLVRAGFRYFFDPRARRQLAAEIRAQFQAFSDTGLTLDHVNAHNHMHLHPTVMSLIIKIGREFGLRAVRLPHSPQGGIAGLFLKPWIALMRRRLRRAGLRHNDTLIGLSETGHMDRATMIAALTSLPSGISEIMTHPATGDWGEREAEAGGFKFADELAALIDPAVRGAVEQSGAELICFAEIA
jgi:hopanoid biosynthesis associated protein HpnK